MNTLKNNATPQPRQLMMHPGHFLSLGFGSGLLPYAPGTFGTLVAVPMYFLLRDLYWWHYLGVVLLLFLLGVWVCQQTAKALGVHDHSSIVWDEVVGYLITMVGAPKHGLWILLGFGLFRLFDIAKPWPIRWIDRHVHGGLGIMLDDLVAGVAAAISMLLIQYSGLLPI